MSLTGYIALGLMVAGVAFGWKTYQLDHLPDFRMIQAEVLFEKCRRECFDVCYRTCELNGTLPADCQCDCVHCEKYIEGE